MLNILTVVSIIEFCYFQDTVTNYFLFPRHDESVKVTHRFMGINYYFIRAVYEWPELEKNPTYPVSDILNFCTLLIRSYKNDQT